MQFECVHAAAKYADAVQERRGTIDGGTAALIGAIELEPDGSGVTNVSSEAGSVIVKRVPAPGCEVTWMLPPAFCTML